MFFSFYFVGFFLIYKIPTAIENTKLKLELAIPTGAPITAAANDVIEMLPHVADKTIDQNNQNLSKQFIKIIKRNNIFTKYSTHQLSFANLSNKIVLDFINFI